MKTFKYFTITVLLIIVWSCNEAPNSSKEFALILQTRSNNEIREEAKKISTGKYF